MFWLWRTGKNLRQVSLSLATYLYELHNTMLCVCRVCSICFVLSTFVARAIWTPSLSAIISEWVYICCFSGARWFRPLWPLLYTGHLEMLQIRGSTACASKCRHSMPVFASKSMQKWARWESAFCDAYRASSGRLFRFLYKHKQFWWVRSLTLWIDRYSAAVIPTDYF